LAGDVSSINGAEAGPIETGGRGERGKLHGGKRVRENRQRLSIGAEAKRGHQREEFGEGQKRG